MYVLSSHINNPESHYLVSMDYKLEQSFLRIHFTVEFQKLFVSNAFSLDSFKNWGLWETDVVEIFITRSEQRTPYLELQFSPLSQKFALIVETPRQQFSYPEELDVKVKSHVNTKSWDCEIHVPFHQIPGSSQEIYGNFHACLGESVKRCYYGYQINSEVSPDFHRPDLFKKLGEIPC